jgi:hypothetical protein
VTAGPRRHVDPLSWAAPYAYAAVLYLLGCAVALRVRHTWPWVAAALVVIPFASDAAMYAGELAGVSLSPYTVSFVLRGPQLRDTCAGEACAALALHGLPWLITTAAWLAGAAGLLALSARQAQRSA